MSCQRGRRIPSASAAARSADLAQRYIGDVIKLEDEWRGRLRESSDLRRDVPRGALSRSCPVIRSSRSRSLSRLWRRSGRRRSRAAVQVAVAQLEAAGVLHPVSSSKRNRAWEADGLLDLVTGLEAGR